jgi:hypothetical protein
VNLKRPPIPDKSKLRKIFVERCATSARDYALGRITLPDAVDHLQDWAFTRGLVDGPGEQDEIQAIMASAFGPVRIDLGVTAVTKPDDQYEGLSSTFAAACRKADAAHGPVPDPPDIPLVSEHGVPSAPFLQRLYEAALTQRDAGRVPQSTLDAADYLVRQKDPARFKRWLEEHSAADQVAIAVHIQRKFGKRS